MQVTRQMAPHGNCVGDSSANFCSPGPAIPSLHHGLRQARLNTGQGCQSLLCQTLSSILTVRLLLWCSGPCLQPQLSAPGSWLLAPGSWLPVPGSWLSVLGSQSLVTISYPSVRPQPLVPSWRPQPSPELARLQAKPLLQLSAPVFTGPVFSRRLTARLNQSHGSLN